MPSEPDVVVVGAGLFGAWLAHRLVVRGARVVLLEADDVGTRAARRRLVVDPGVLGHPDAAGSKRHRRVLSMLSAQAPHLVRPAPMLASTGGPMGRARALAALSLHDAASHGEGPLAQAQETSGHGLRLSAPIALSGHTLDEARLVLALALAASARGADVRTGARVERVEADGDALRVTTASASLRARAVVLTAGGDLAGLTGGRPSLLPEAALEHALELLLPAPLCGELFVDLGPAARLEHVPYLDRSIVRVTSDRPPTLASTIAQLERCGLSAPIEVLDRIAVARHRGPVQLRQGSLPGLFTVSGSELTSVHAEVERLARKLAGGGPMVGDDTRLEDGDFEVTPSIERTRLGHEILSAMGARHGERATAIVERVMSAPREGAVVCPCSTVTEAELRHAHREELARDLCALSRRTELGVGACRGVRCAHRAAAILAEASPAPTGTRTGTAFLTWRSERALVEPARNAALDELARGLDVGAGEPELPIS